MKRTLILIFISLIAWGISAKGDIKTENKDNVKKTEKSPGKDKKKQKSPAPKPIIPYGIRHDKDSLFAYAYTGNEVLSDSIASTFSFRDGVVYYVKGKIQSKDKVVFVGLSPDNLIISDYPDRFKPKAKCYQIAVSYINDFQKIDSVCSDSVNLNLVVSALNDSVYLLTNNSENKINLFKDGEYQRTIGPTQSGVIKDTLGVTICSGASFPATITFKQIEIEQKTDELGFIDKVKESVLQCFSCEKSNKKEKSTIRTIVVTILSVLLLLSMAIWAYCKRNKIKHLIKIVLKRAELKSVPQFVFYKPCGHETICQRFEVPDDGQDEFVDYLLSLYSEHRDYKKIKESIQKQISSGEVFLPLLGDSISSTNEHKDGWQEIKLRNKKWWVKPFDQFVPTLKAQCETEAILALEQFLYELKKNFVLENGEFDTERLHTDVDVEGNLAQNYQKFVSIVEKCKNEFEELKSNQITEEYKLSIEVDCKKQSDKRLEEQEKSYGNQIETLIAQHKSELKKKLQEKDDEWKRKTKQLQEERDKAVTECKEWEEKYNAEHDKCVKLENKIDELNLIIERLEKESKEYNTKLVFYKSCQEYAKVALNFIDTSASIKSLSNNLYNDYKEKGKDMDAFCYYKARFDEKYENGMQVVKHLEKYIAEISMLAQTGLVYKGGWIDSFLSSVKNEKSWVSQLSIKMYNDLFSSYAGWAVIWADEYAYLMKTQVRDVNDSIIKKFVTVSDTLQKLVNDLGYNLCYACPTKSVTKYSNVENVEFVNVDFAKDVIFEIKKMAVNHGTSKSKTQVSVQE